MSAADAVPRQPWRPIGQRRRLAALERTFQHSLQWAVFEFNGEALWARARTALEEVLFNEWKLGNLRGSSADQAYFVRCDHTTMTQHDIDNARMIAVVGLAIVKPSEFAILRIVQSTAT